jgi:hypothetical protein
MGIVLLIILCFPAALAGLALLVVRLTATDRRLVEARGNAVEIAARFGSVSAFQLAARAEISVAQAETVLRIACGKGLLFEGTDGAYYTFPQKAPEESTEGALRWLARFRR